MGKKRKTFVIYTIITLLVFGLFFSTNSFADNVSDESTTPTEKTNKQVEKDLLEKNQVEEKPKGQNLNTQEQNEENMINQQNTTNQFRNEENKISNIAIHDSTIQGDPQIDAFIERKGSQLVGMLQRGAKYFAIISFILCGALMLFGSFGNSKLISTGLLGLIITLVVYAVILHAPELMDMFVMWTKS